jgi:hypothetical protein
MMMREHLDAQLSRNDLQRLPVVQAAMAIVQQPAPAAERPAPSLRLVPEVEQTARPLHPVAHWVLMPTGGGHARLEMIWETPDPMPLDR